MAGGGRGEQGVAESGRRRWLDVGGGSERKGGGRGTAGGGRGRQGRQGVAGDSRGT